MITGFRVASGGAQELYGVEPDLTVFGKVIGGGLPAAAFGGPRRLMERIAPAGDVYQAGTLSGNPLAVAAGLATLARLDEDAYRRLGELTAILAAGLRELAAGLPAPGGRGPGPGDPLLQPRRRSRTSPPPRPATPRPTPASAGRCSTAASTRRPSQFEAWFVSLAHTEEAIETDPGGGLRGARGGPRVSGSPGDALREIAAGAARGRDGDLPLRGRAGGGARARAALRRGPPGRGGAGRVRASWSSRCARASSSTTAPRVCSPATTLTWRCSPGDYLYALGIERLASLGDSEAVLELSDLISLAAASQAEPAHAHSPELWLAATVAVGCGSSEASREAKRSARALEPDAADRLWQAAAETAAACGLSDELRRAAEAIELPRPRLADG